MRATAVNQNDVMPAVLLQSEVYVAADDGGMDKVKNIDIHRHDLKP